MLILVNICMLFYYFIVIIDMETLNHFVLIALWFKNHAGATKNTGKSSGKSRVDQL